MRFNEIKVLNEATFNSKQEVIDHFVKQGKSAAAGASAWERGWRGSKPKAKKPTGPVRSYHDDLDDKRYGETNEAVAELESQLAEAALGTAPKRPSRTGSRPARGHATESRYKKVDYCDACDRPKAECVCDEELDESGKASRALCVSSKPDSDLGASQLSSCKAQGLRARDGKKSHKVGKSRVTVGGKKIKGKQYGGPLPDWS